jgi:hypothetical protein
MRLGIGVTNGHNNHNIPANELKACLDELPHLTEVHFAGSWMTDQHLMMLRRRRLTHLSLAGLTNITPARLRTCLDELPHLTEVKFDGDWMTDQHLATLPRRRLTHLTLHGEGINNITPDGFKNCLNGLPDLEKLELADGGLYFLPSDVFNRVIENLPPRIVDLNLALQSNNAVEISDLTPLALMHLKSLFHLRYLRLSDIQNGDQLADSLPVNLESLDLNFLKSITPAGCEKLMTNLPWLKKVVIQVSTSEQYNAILKNISIGIEDLTIYIQGPRREYIFLEDEALQHLNRLHHLKKILTHTDKISDVCVSKLIKHLPPQVTHLIFPFLHLRKLIQEEGRSVSAFVRTLQTRYPKAVLDTL